MRLNKKDCALVIRNGTVKIIIPKMKPEDTCSQDMLLCSALAVMASDKTMRQRIISEFIKEGK